VSIDWSELYRATFRDLVTFLYRKVWDPELARDLAQEVFVRALRSEPENPRAWLFTVAANLARDEARRVARRKRHLALLKSDGESRVAAPEDPVDQLADRERRERAKRALSDLADKDREVLLLWDAGLSYQEIATETGLAPGSVGTTLARARKRMVEAYQELEARHAARE
jgi:RNA polymerase sigma-70 factor (ECF subfamily)